jgi:SpoVK/Ycf46/Vps4 family AAA+-type ATPase
MFESITDLADKLAATKYFIDPVMTQVVFLAAKLQKPLLLEGPAGSGKTQLAISVAAAAGTHVERLQCYRGVTEDKAIGRFDEGLQRLYMEFSKGQHENWQTVQANLKGRDFFRPGPLMRALECDRPCVLLIDELDKVDDGFEAGAQSVVSTLWELEDHATAKLMANFYEHLSRHEGKAEALRQAQLEMLTTGAPPYYWAGFQLDGEPSGSLFSETKSANSSRSTR